MTRTLSVLIFLALWACPLAAQKLTIYTEIAPPFQYEAPDGSLTGFSVDLVRELQRRVGNADPITLVPWVRGYNEALTRPNVLLFAMDRSLEREQSFQWVGPIGEADYWFFVKARSPIAIRSLEDARKLKLIGVYKEDIRDQALTRMGFRNLDRSTDPMVILKKLADDRIEALVDSQENMEQFTKLAGLDMKDFRGAHAFMKTQTYLAFSNLTARTVVEAWRKALDATKRDGTFEALFQKYLPGTPLPGPALKPM